MKHIIKYLQRFKQWILFVVIGRFTKQDLELAYRIGYNHAKACAKYQDEEIVDALLWADNMDRNIKWD